MAVCIPLFGYSYMLLVNILIDILISFHFVNVPIINYSGIVQRSLMVGFGLEVVLSPTQTARISLVLILTAMVKGSFGDLGRIFNTVSRLLK